MRATQQKNPVAYSFAIQIFFFFGGRYLDQQVLDNLKATTETAAKQQARKWAEDYLDKLAIDEGRNRSGYRADLGWIEGTPIVGEIKAKLPPPSSDTGSIVPPSTQVHVYTTKPCPIHALCSINQVLNPAREATQL